MVAYKLFEGKQKLQLLDGRKREAKDFEEIRKVLGFKKKVSFMAFCTAVGLCTTDADELTELPEDLSHLFGNQVDISGFGREKAKLFDIILLLVRGKKKDRLKEFKKYFIYGLKRIVSWYEKNGDKFKDKLEGFSYLTEDLIKKREKQSTPSPVRRRISLEGTPYEILKDFENVLRLFIMNTLREEVGKNWWKQRIPSDVKNRCKERKKEREQMYPWMEKTEYPLLNYASFSDYHKIIIRRDNWREIFKKFFGRKVWIEAKLLELSPIRTDIAHNRELKPGAIEKLKTNAKDILKCIQKRERT